MAEASLTNKKTYETRISSGQIYGQIGPRDLKRFGATAKHIIPGLKSMLDVGCFGGDWLSFVVRRLNIDRSLGVDVSEARIKQAKRRYPNLNFKVGYAEQLDLPASSFDLVTCLEVLEHIPKWLDVFHALFKFASKQVLISVPYHEKPVETPCVHCGKLTPLFGHLRTYSEETFPDVEGWSKVFSRLAAWNPNRSLPVKVYRLIKPHYIWLIADYRRK